MRGRVPWKRQCREQGTEVGPEACGNGRHWSRLHWERGAGGSRAQVGASRTAEVLQVPQVPQREGGTPRTRKTRQHAQHARHALHHPELPRPHAARTHAPGLVCGEVCRVARRPSTPLVRKGSRCCAVVCGGGGERQVGEDGGGGGRWSRGRGKALEVCTSQHDRTTAGAACVSLLPLPPPPPPAAHPRRPTSAPHLSPPASASIGPFQTPLV